MVAIKIVFTVLGICVACSRTAPNSQTVISKLLIQPEDKDFKIPVRNKANVEVSPQNYYNVRTSRKTNRETISKSFRGLLLKEQLNTKNINDKRSPGPNSKAPSEVQVSPNEHSDYLHIENYVPTFITIPCDSRSCDLQSYASLNCQILSHIIQSHNQATNSINCPQYAPSQYDGADHSYIISEAPNLLSTSDEYLSATELSEISKFPLIESEHLATPELSSLPSTNSHPEFYETSYDIVNDAINADLHHSGYHKFAEFSSYPQLSITAHDEIFTPGIETNLPLNPPSPFESTVYLPIPEPPAYFPLNLSNNEAVNHSNVTVSLQDPYDPSNNITIPDNTPSTFENQPIIVIPEASMLMPFNPPNISYSYSPENTTSDAFIQTIYSDYSETFHTETTPQRGDIKESINTSDIQTNAALNPASPIEQSVLIPEPPIYFPLKPTYTNAAGPNKSDEKVILLGNYESYNTITIPETTPSSVDGQPHIIIPEAPELMPLKPNITFGSSLQNISTHEVTQTVYSDYSDQSYPEIATEPDEIIESTYVYIPPAPALMPLNPPNVILASTDISHSNEKLNSTIVGAEILNISSVVQSSKPNKGHTIDHAHSITFEDSPYLLISHFTKTQNDLALMTSEFPTTSPNLDDSSLLNEVVEITDAPDLTPSNKPHVSIISTDTSLYSEDNTEKVIYYDNQKESLSVDSVKIPEAPLLMPLNPPFTSPSLNSIVTSNHSFVNAVIQGEKSFNTNEVNLPSNPQTSTLQSDIIKDELFEISEVPTTEPPTVPPNPILEGSQLNHERTPLNILLTMNQQITLPHILQNSNVLVMSNNHNEIRGQEQHSISSSPEYSSSVNADSDPLSIVQDSNIVVSPSPIIVEKTNEIVSQLDSTIQKLKMHNTEKQMQRNFKDLPPCRSENPIDGVVINVFEPKKCKLEVNEWRTNSSSKQSISKRSRRRKVVVRNPKTKQTNVTRN